MGGGSARRDIAGDQLKKAVLSYSPGEMEVTTLTSSRGGGVGGGVHAEIDDHTLRSIGRSLTRRGWSRANALKTAVGRQLMGRRLPIDLRDKSFAG